MNVRGQTTKLRGQTTKRVRLTICRVAVACLVVCPLSPLTFAQSMYKWVDEKGVTHFTQEPPPPEAKSGGKIEVRTTTPERAPTDNWREREAQSKAQRARQGVADEQARQKEESERANNCRRAQRQMDTFGTPGRVYRLNEKGERVYYEDKDYDAKLAEARENIARYCR